MKTQEILDVAVKAGEILLKSGAEIYRVEDTITHICESYQLRCETVVLPTGIFISANKPGENVISTTKRIRNRTVDLTRVERINNFSRALRDTPLQYEEAWTILEEMENTTKYGFWTRFAASGIAAFAFTLLVKGSWLDGLVATIIGIFIFLFREQSARTGLFLFFEFFVSGMIAGFFSMAFDFVLQDISYYKIIIGSILMLLPGVAITNSVKDALYGDLVASLARLGEALLMVAALGAGVGIMISIGLRWM